MLSRRKEKVTLIYLLNARDHAPEHWRSTKFHWEHFVNCKISQKSAFLSGTNLISRNFELKINFVTIPFLYRQYKQFRACSEKQIFLFKKICIDEKSKFFHNVHFGKSKSSVRVWNISRREYFASGIFRVWNISRLEYFAF